MCMLMTAGSARSQILPFRKTKEIVMIDTYIVKGSN